MKRKGAKIESKKIGYDQELIHVHPTPHSLSQKGQKHTHTQKKN